jgi:RNA polymerase sigma factor (TIGR02999 family)
MIGRCAAPRATTLKPARVNIDVVPVRSAADRATEKCQALISPVRLETTDRSASLIETRACGRTGWRPHRQSCTAKRHVPCLPAISLAGIIDLMNEVTRVLSAIEQGDPHAAAELLPLVYDELRKLAAGHMANEAAGHSLNAKALVHEAYLRLAGGQQFDNRGHFFAAAAEAMRRILVEKARQKRRLKHGGGRLRLDLDAAGSLAEDSSEGLIALDEALDKLAAEDPAGAELVKLRFYGGLTMPEIAEVMKISLRTAERQWVYARTWLYAELTQRENSRGG